MDKESAKKIGFVLILVGLIIVIIGIYSFFSSAKNITKIESPDNIGGIFFGTGLGMILIFIGVLLMGAGSFIIYIASIGKITSYVAKETSPGTEKISHAVGKGLASGVKKGWKGK
jgi:drug/metabolite transporter (DMT)-like permease